MIARTMKETECDIDTFWLEVLIKDFEKSFSLIYLMYTLARLCCMDQARSLRGDSDRMKRPSPERRSLEGLVAS